MKRIRAGKRSSWVSGLTDLTSLPAGVPESLIVPRGGCIDVILDFTESGVAYAASVRELRFDGPRPRISSWRARRERKIEPSVMRSASREVGIRGEKSESSIIRSGSDLSGFSRGTVRNQPPDRLKEGVSNFRFSIWAPARTLEFCS